MTFDDALEELRFADDDIDDVVRALLGMATFAGIIGRRDKLDAAVKIAAELIEGRAARYRRRTGGK